MHGRQVFLWASSVRAPGRYHPDGWPIWLQMTLCGALGVLIACAGLW